MNCKSYESWIALHVEGDLPKEHTADLEGHLARCPACKGLVEAFRESQEALRALASEDVSHAADRVSTRVLGQLQEERTPAESRRGWPMLPVGLAAAALVAIIAAVAGLMPSRSPGSAPKILETNVVQTVRQDDDALPSIYKGEAEANDLDVRLAATPSEKDAPENPVVIKILTNNPDIVIYWLGGAKENNHEQVSV